MFVSKIFATRFFAPIPIEFENAKFSGHVHAERCERCHKMYFLCPIEYAKHVCEKYFCFVLCAMGNIFGAVRSL